MILVKSRIEINLVNNGTFNTADSKEFKVNPKSWEQGAYKVTFKTQDKYGEKIELVKQFTLFSPKAQKVPLTEALYTPNTYQIKEPGETASFNIGSFLSKSQ